MGDRLNESDVARILKVSEPSVRRLIEEDVLSGAQSEEGDWWTTEELLLGDLAVLTENARIQRFREGNYVSPWVAGLKEGDLGYVSSRRIEVILEGREAGPG